MESIRGFFSWLNSIRFYHSEQFSLKHAQGENAATTAEAVAWIRCGCREISWTKIWVNIFMAIKTYSAYLVGGFNPFEKYYI